MKEQGKNSQDQINEEELGKLTEKELKLMITKMIQNLQNWMEKMQESINMSSQSWTPLPYGKTNAVL